MSSNLIVRSLYEQALCAPVFQNSANRLCVVSGYASSAMGFHHLQNLVDLGKIISVDLIYGMTKADGLPTTECAGFRSLAVESFPERFSCSYLKTGEPVHAKVYVWLHGDQPVRAFTGSANYTQQAFLRSFRREVLAECDPNQAFDFFKSLSSDCIDCRSPEVERLFSVGFRKKKTPAELEPFEVPFPSPFASSVSTVTDTFSEFYGMQMATISLLDKTGQVPARSGLNWGQRPELSREPNQAYLSVRGALRTSDFFPPRGVHFTVLCDDGTIMEMTRAQQDAKAIETPHDNSIIGRYFRKRLGLPDGAFVRTEDVVNYGRSSVSFYKIDDENFYMDFKQPVV